jgi:release factor glutamine methyltransferase
LSFAGATRFRTVLKAIANLLESAGIPDPAAEARAMLRAVAPTGLGFTDFLDKSPAEYALAYETLRHWTDRRLAREPLDRITGMRSFWTLDLALSPATLSPRQDTETLVEVALETLRSKGLTRPRILDLGTGSGAILLSLLVELPEATGLGIDLSPGAIVTAQENAIANGHIDPTLAGRSTFKTGNWFAGIEERFDLVVSNPPYIRSSVIRDLEPEVRNHDPVLALDGGADGLDAYRKIFSGAAHHLTNDGFVVVEIGFDQAAEVGKLANDCAFDVIDCRQDLSGNDRVLLLWPRLSAQNVANT